MSLVARLEAAAKHFDALAYDWRAVKHDPWLAAVYDRHAAAVRDAIAIVAAHEPPRRLTLVPDAGDSTDDAPVPPAA